MPLDFPGSYFEIPDLDAGEESGQATGFGSLDLSEILGRYTGNVNRKKPAFGGRKTSNTENGG